MSYLVFVNCSLGRTNYWSNSVEGDLLKLVTHPAAAIELAIAAESSRAQIILKSPGFELFGPVVLQSWEKRKDFFAFGYSDFKHRTKTALSAAETKKVQRLFEKGEHLVICRDGVITSINFMTPGPTIGVVENILNRIISPIIAA